MPQDIIKSVQNIDAFLVARHVTLVGIYQLHVALLYDYVPYTKMF